MDGLRIRAGLLVEVQQLLILWLDLEERVSGLAEDFDLVGNVRDIGAVLHNEPELELVVDGIDLLSNVDLRLVLGHELLWGLDGVLGGLQLAELLVD